MVNLFHMGRSNQSIRLKKRQRFVKKIPLLLSLLLGTLKRNNRHRQRNFAKYTPQAQKSVVLGIEGLRPSLRRKR